MGLGDAEHSTRNWGLRAVGSIACALHSEHGSNLRAKLRRFKLSCALRFLVNSNTPKKRHGISVWQ
eukprot:1841217-Amphidinium_carterae.1